MDKSAEIAKLRKEHKLAIEQYDYDQAEFIENQIQQLRNQISMEFRHSQNPTTSSVKNTQQRPKEDKTTIAAKEFEIKKRYEYRLEMIEDRYDQEREALSEVHSRSLDLEMQRRIPSVQNLLKESQGYGNQHEYDQARAIYREAMSKKRHVLTQRRIDCNATFLRAQRTLDEKQMKSIQLLHEKEEAELAALRHTRRKS